MKEKLINFIKDFENSLVKDFNSKWEDICYYNYCLGLKETCLNAKTTINNTDTKDVNIPENKDSAIINKILINKEHQKYKLIQENYKNLSSWSGGTTNVTNTTTTKSKITIQHENNDPMKHILNPTTSNNNNNEPIINNSITQSRGFYLPKCKYTAPLNRFGILPGYRWDGVDRSNGFEKKYFETQNERSAQAIEYFKIRSEDL